MTAAERKRILLDHIYGVDVDPQAVEVKKLSLLLKVLEGENAESLERQLRLFRQRALPDLANNIKCGNSLIGHDFDQNQHRDLFDEEILRINAFDWETEYADIMTSGGFDAVIGNPPYRMLQPHNTQKTILHYLRKSYPAAEFKIEMFHLFIQRGVSLLKGGGHHGHIVPTTLLNNVYAENLRAWLLERCAIESIAVALHRVFAAADVHTSVLVLRREDNAQLRDRQLVRTSSNLSEDFVRNPTYSGNVTQRRFTELPGKVWNILITEENANLLQRLNRDYGKLGQIGETNRGLITGDRAKYFSNQKETAKHMRILAGRDVHRYFVDAPSEYVLFDRPNTSGGCWDRKVHLARHKILVRQIGIGPTAAWIDKPFAVTGNIFTVRCSDRSTELFVLGILNSRLTAFFWKVMFTDFKHSFPQVTIFSLDQVPICLPARSSKRIVSRLVAFVQQTLDLHKQLSVAKTSHEKTAIQRRIDATDRPLDRLVYELYGLTDEEIRIVEEATER